LVFWFVNNLYNNTIGALKSSDVYKEAVAKARADPTVRASLGDPITENWWVVGSLDNNSRKGALVLSLTGPKGMGILMAEVDKKGDKWDYTKLEVQIPNPQGGPPTVIDLLKANNGPEGNLVPAPLILEPADLILQSTAAQTLAPAGGPAGSLTPIIAASRITQLELFAPVRNPGDQPRN
jgi:hypothetical protein